MTARLLPSLLLIASACAASPAPPPPPAAFIEAARPAPEAVPTAAPAAPPPSPCDELAREHRAAIAGTPFEALARQRGLEARP